MVRHTVLWRFHEGLPDERLEAFGTGVDDLIRSVPSISGAAHGRALRIQPSPIDYVLQLDFPDRAAFEAYKQHPAHHAFIESHARECVAETFRAQFEV